MVGIFGICLVGVLLYVGLTSVLCVWCMLDGCAV